MIGCVHASDHVLYRLSAVALPHAGLQRLPVALRATSSAANIGRSADGRCHPEEDLDRNDAQL
jgi:hypothetical protein